MYTECHKILFPSKKEDLANTEENCPVTAEIFSGEKKFLLVKQLD